MVEKRRDVTENAKCGCNSLSPNWHINENMTSIKRNIVLVSISIGRGVGCP